MAVQNSEKKRSNCIFLYFLYTEAIANSSAPHSFCVLSLSDATLNSIPQEHCLQLKQHRAQNNKHFIPQFQNFTFN